MRNILWMGLLLVLGATLALAQATTGSIYGTVRTAEGLVIQDVKVTLSAGHLTSMEAMTGASATSTGSRTTPGSTIPSPSRAA